MKKHRFAKTVLGVAGLLGLGTMVPAFAQTAAQEQSNPPAAAQPGPGMRGHGDGPFADLNLSDDQKAQIKKIHTDAKAHAAVVRADSSLSDADKQAKIRSIHKTAMMESEKLLTPEQRAQLEEKMKERRAAKSQPNPS